MTSPDTYFLKLFARYGMMSPTFVQANLPILLEMDQTITADMACPATHDRLDSIIAADMIVYYVTFDRVDSIIAADAIVCYATLDRVDSIIAGGVIVCSTTLDQVDFIITADAIVCYATLDWVDLIITAEVIVCYPTLGRVDSIIAAKVIVCYTTLDWVDSIIAANVRVCYTTLDQADSIITVDMMAHCPTHDWVDFIITADVMAHYIPHEMMAVATLVDVMTCSETRDWVNLTNQVWVYSTCNQKKSLPFVTFCNFVWRDITSVYDVQGYPYFISCSRQSDFLSFNETVKLYVSYLSGYQLVYVIEFIFHWSNHLCYFVSQNMEMLINFDLTPQQLCKRAYLIICRSQYLKHDFAIISSVTGVSTKYIVADIVKYSENILHWIFQHRYFNKMNARYSAKRSFKIPISNSLNSVKYEVPDRIGGGQHGASIEKINMNVISQFVISAPTNSFDIKVCEFVEHLEISKGLKKYDGSDYVLCSVPLHLLTNCLFQNSRIAIGHMHGIQVSRKMTMSEITELFKIHDNICEHKYVTVFYPYKYYSCSKQGLEYHKVQTSQVSTNLKQLESLEVNGSGHVTFPPDPPNASLRRKIINDFVMLLNLQSLKKLDVLCVVHSPCKQNFLI